MADSKDKEEMAPRAGDPAMGTDPMMGEAPTMGEPTMEENPMMGEAPHEGQHESLLERVEHLIHHDRKQ